MQSVEEICDDIALINRSRLVLSGTVRDVRAQHRSPFARLTLAGEVPAEALTTLPIQELRIERGDTHLRLKVDQEHNLRTILPLVPNQYDVLEYHQEVPSMHEIFLKTVQA